MKKLLIMLLLCSISLLSFAQIGPYIGPAIINPAIVGVTASLWSPPSPAAAVSILNNPVTAAQWHYAGKQDLLTTIGNPSQDWVYSLVSTNKKETIACGYGLANEGDGYGSGIIFKLDHNGNLAWKSLVQYINTANFMTNTTGTLTPSDHTSTLFWSVTKATDGYIAVGYANEAILVAEVNEAGGFINNTPILINLPYTVNQTDISALSTGFPTTTLDGYTPVDNYIRARGYCVAVDPYTNSVNNIIVGGRMQCGYVDPVYFPHGYNWYDLGYMVTLKYDPSVSGALYGWSLVKTFYGGNQNEINYYDCSYGLIYGGPYGNTINKIITKSTGGSSYEIYACGAKAGEDDNTPVCDAGPSGSDLTVMTYDKDIWVLKMDNNYSTASYSEQTYNKNNIYVNVGGTSVAPINTYGTDTYPYQDVGPFTARNVNGSNQIISDGTPSCNASRWFNASNNKVELGYDMIFSHDGELALVALVNFTGELYDNISNAGGCGGLMSEYDEYKDGDAFLIKLHTDLSFDKAKNVGHFSGNDFIMHIGQEPLEWNYIITGSTSDQYAGDPVNLPSPELDPSSGNVTGVNAFMVATDNTFTSTSRDLWRRSFVASDTRAAGDVTPHSPDGNFEDCFCGFAMDITADGGYMIGGNNDNNGDDHSLTKFAPLHENQLIGTGGYTTFGYSDIPSTYTVGSFGGGTSETWPNSNVPSGSNIATKVIVPSGVTLTINTGTFNFAASDQLYDYFSAPNGGISDGGTFGCGIVVQPGGNLVINGATLGGINTLAGEHNVWDGIVIQGTADQPASGLQGTAYITNTNINDARVGIYVADDYRAYNKINSTFDPSNLNYSSRYDGTYWMGGGIATVEGTFFTNCFFGADFQNYYHGMNPSLFYECQFISDANGMGDICFYTDANGHAIPINTHITSWQWYSLELRKNTFSCDPSFATQLRPIGIHISGGSGADISNSGSGTDPGNTFANLSYGIITSGSICGDFPVTIAYNNFDNNTYCINASSKVSTLIAKYNTMLIPGYNSLTAISPTGMTLAGCSGYDVSQNIFDKCSACTTPASWNGNYGIVINNAGSENEQLKLNQFNNVSIASIAVGNNGNTSSNTGLQFHCNYYNQNIYGIMRCSSFTGISGFYPNTLAPQQGYCGTGSDPTTPANNLFYTCPTGLSFPPHLFATDAGVAQNVTYNFINAAPYDPGTTGVCVQTTNGSYTILNKVPCTLGTIPTPGDACPPPPTVYYSPAPGGITGISGILAELTSLDAELASATDPDLIIALQAQHDEDVAIATRHYAQVGDFSSAAGLLASYGQYRTALPMYMMAGDYTDAETMYNNLPLTTTEEQLYAYEAGLAINLYSNGKSWLDLDAASLTTLQGTVQYDQASGYTAGGITALLGIAPVTWPIPQISSDLLESILAYSGDGGDGSRMSHGSSVNHSNTGTESFSLFPNPTSGTFTITSSGGGKLLLMTILGQQLQQYTLQAGQSDILLPAGLAAGIYIGKFTSDDGSINKEVRIVFKP